MPNIFVQWSINMLQSVQYSMTITIFLKDDIVVEVFAWLPPKEIVRLRCVCKRWLFLSTRFIENYSARNPHPAISGFFLRDHVYEARYFPLNANLSGGLPSPSLSFIPHSDQRARISIEASCNGLIICSHVIRRALPKPAYYVCNPTTRKFVELHVPPGVDGCLSLVFDPSKSPHYKVVSLGSQIHVYSSETRSWKLSIDNKSLREFDSEFEFDFSLSYCRSVYWNGALIWMGNMHLISFDGEKECMKPLPMPPQAYAFPSRVCFGESGGKLQLIWRSPIDKDTIFYISEMDSESLWWAVLCKVDLEPIMKMYPYEIWKQQIYISGLWGSASKFSLDRPAFLPVYVIRGVDEEDGELLLNVPGKIISYNLIDKVFTEVCDLSSPIGTYDCLYDWQKFYPFGHTLHELV